MQPAEQVNSKVAITLPDGSVREYDGPVTGAEIAQSIGKRLAKDALAVKVDGAVRDLSLPITGAARVEIVTRSHPDALELIRHDAAHILAEAVQELYPGTQVTIGPAIANGFYYDFVNRDEPFTCEVWDRDRAIEHFQGIGERYKAELIASIPEGEPITIYRQGRWYDLCRGPHMPSTGRIGHAFKLTKVAGAYWRGDHRNPMLQRVYGTAWRDEKELEAYLHQLEEAERRDHRRLGREMDLFHLQEEATGSVFWHAKGYVLWRTLENYVRRRIHDDGYVEVRTPQLIDRSLWEASGHWDKFREHMFTVSGEDEKVLALKPMNCPAHVQIYRQGITSYRDLPIRMAEFGSCHRNEPSGALHGIMRVRAFTQDDAHIFCTPAQITEESVRFCRLLMSVYRDLGFQDVFVKFSDRPATRAGSDEVWDRAEAALKEAVEAAGLPYELNPGEGAFYGPKLEFTLRDAIGRDWQCGTLQVDFVLPERLGADYVGEDGQRHRPVMLHRAILGSMERFIGVLIEHYAGRFPLWLAPVQAVVATITNEADPYAAEVHAALSRAGIRAELDTRNEKINFKVREHSLAKVPLILAIGKREAEQRTVALRRLGGQQQETLALEDALNKIREEARSPAGNLVPDTPF
jgi:threonyl-tRNA synthetase